MSKEMYDVWLKSVAPVEREELLTINEGEIRERFEMELAFGTAGMRGEVGLGTFRMNRYTVRRATAGLAKYILSLGQDAQKRGVVVSYDTRRFSREFAFDTAAVLAAYGVAVHVFEDVRPVPVCSYAVRAFRAAAGVMITASHNPKEYNGYKVYGEDGAQMSPEATAEVVAFIKDTADYFNIPAIEISDIYSCKGKDNIEVAPGVTVIGKSLDEKYYKEVLKLALSPDYTKRFGKDVKLVYTPVHGAGYVPVTTVFKMLGINASVVEEQALPDTEFSTVQVPNPENTDTMKLGIALGNKIGADVVLATDPDCDRLGVAVRTDTGEFILLSGNQIGVLLLDYIAARLQEKGQLPKNAAVVKSIVTTTLADRIAKSYGVTPFNVLTGFKFIGEKIKEWEESGEYQYIFGFEESYGTLCGTHARDKDAVVGSMLFAEMLIYYRAIGKSVYTRLLEIFKKFGYYAEKNVSVAYKGLAGMSDMAAVMEKLRNKRILALGEEKVYFTTDYLSGIQYNADGTKEKAGLPQTDALYFGLFDSQFVCIRPSGTEPKLKIYVLIYAESEAAAKEKADRVMTAVKKEL